MTAALFWEKFYQGKTERAARKALESYVRRGVLAALGADRSLGRFSEMVYTLTLPALKVLEAHGVALLRTARTPRVNFKELDHDLRVARLRMAFERSPELEGMFWVSDFELRCGISPNVKAEFLRGRLDVEKWRCSPVPGNRRTPDGYFEASSKGVRCSFILEYEHARYPGARLRDVVLYLDRGFPDALRLVVCQNVPQGQRMLRELKRRVQRPELWLVSTYEKVLSAPFTEAWANVVELRM